MSGIDYAARVQRGAALLDEKWPTWAQDIDLDLLDIADGSDCVTAQYNRAMGGASLWCSGRNRLELTTTEYIGHGFNAPDLDISARAALDIYATLNALWRDLIQERRAQAQPEANER